MPHEIAAPPSWLDAFAADQDRRRAAPSPSQHAQNSLAALLAAHDPDALPPAIAAIAVELEARITARERHP